MKPVLIIQHVADDGPSYFATWLDLNGYTYDVRRMFAGDSLPADIHAYAGLCVLGGPMSANDDLPYFPALFAMVRDAVAAGIPVIGHCLGGQIMSKALGGEIGRSAHVEIGWSQLTVEDAEVAADWFAGESAPQLFQWHGETFSIPPGARRIVTGAYCANQAFLVGDLHIGMQFHCEVDAPKVRRWLINGHDELINTQSPAVQQAAAILPGLEVDLVASQRVAGAIYARWVRGLRA
ncbi:MAG: type 1 glutamine amidotransferase [Burkholderiales bacterium]|nr:type 1 glutamine amidotransferase [Burkholderiales bacterium]